jgi:hypothetical protein
MNKAEPINVLLLKTIEDIQASGEVIDGKRKLEDHPRRKMEEGEIPDWLKGVFK